MFAQKNFKLGKVVLSNFYFRAKYSVMSFYAFANIIPTPCMCKLWIKYCCRMAWG